MPIAVDSVAYEALPPLIPEATDASTRLPTRATLCLTAARSVGGGRVMRYSGSRR